MLVACLLLVTVQAESCHNPPYLLSECSPDQVRTAIGVGSECNQPDAVHSLSCAATCASGAFLSLDLHTQKSDCMQCPANTYSLGGGSVIPAKEVLLSFSPLCHKGNSPCAGWGQGQEELEVQASAEDGWQEAWLSRAVHMMRDGRLQVTYRKQSRTLNFQPLGVFSLLIDGKTVFEDHELDYEWRIESVPVPKNTSEISLKYRFYHIPGVDMRAGIREILISGISSSDLSCWKCQQGWSLPGSSHCSSCPANQFFNVTASGCSLCPPDHFSPENSLNIADCRPLPVCEDEDYEVVLGACIDYIQTVETRVKGVCRDNGRAGTVTGPCQSCLPGYHYAPLSPGNGAICVSCPVGMRTGSTDRDDCVPCLSDEYAPLTLNFTQWKPLPEGFVNECWSRISEHCLVQQGWKSSQSTLFAEAVFDEEELVISRYVDIVQQPAYVSFVFTIQGRENSCALSLEIDGFEVLRYTSTALKAASPSIPLSRGIRKLALRLHTIDSTAQTVVYIHQIEILGAQEGGAIVCRPCPPGFISVNHASDCQPCPAGWTSVQGTHCEQCNSTSISVTPGSGCGLCPYPSVSNENRTACIAPVFLPSGPRQIAIQELARTYSYSGICNKTSVRMYCRDSFYGPISSHNTQFFVSILNPGKDKSMSYEYAYAVKYTSNDVNKCGRKAVEMVNLGSLVGNITIEPGVVNISYIQGSMCGNGFYSASMQLKCEKEAKEGWVEGHWTDACHAQFEWKTAYVCKVCEEQDLLRMTGACQDGYRTETYREPHNCITRREHLWQVRVACSVAENLDSWAAVALMVLFACMLPMAFILLLCYIRFKRRYVLLVEMSRRVVE